MTRVEAAQVAMQDSVADFLDKNKDIFVKYPRLNSEITKFLGLRVMLAPMVAKQSEITTGITVGKKSAFITMGSQVVKLAPKALIYANDIDNLALAAVFTITASSFKYQSQAKQLIQAQAFADALIDNATALVAYNITATDISTLTDIISACKGHTIAPSAASSGKKAATTSIKKTLTDINGSLAIIDSLITSEYIENTPDLVNEYFNNRHIDAKGVRHTGIAVTFTAAATGNVIEGATINIASLNKTAISNINGMAEIPKMRTGTYHISFSANGYAAQTQDVVVPRSRKVDMAVVLTAV